MGFSQQKKLFLIQFFQFPLSLREKKSENHTYWKKIILFFWLFDNFKVNIYSKQINFKLKQILFDVHNLFH